MFSTQNTDMKMNTELSCYVHAKYDVIHIAKTSLNNEMIMDRYDVPN